MTTPAGEWLIDNFHLVERQIRQISTDLPPGYYRQLPKLLTGPFAGYPRVFGMAWAFVAHTDRSFDSEILVSYVNAYQEIQPLTIGELWAVSLTLQIVLIENLRRLAQQITRSRAARHEADRLADRLLGVSGRPRNRRRSFSPDVARSRFPRPSQSNSCIGFAIKIRNSRRRWLGSTSGSRNRASLRIRPCAKSIAAKGRRT